MTAEDGAGAPHEAALRDRKHWMAVLAKADAASLERAWSAHGAGDFARLRGPETGLVMVRGRAGGDGRRFNLGEMTVSRCSVRGRDGVIGHAYVAGRDHRHAELAARFDALLQDETLRPRLLREVIAPLAEAQAAARREVREKAAATRVEFFTMVRGE